MDNDRLTQLPMARIRTVMKTSPDMGNINPEALFLMCRAAEKFIEYMAKGAHRQGKKSLEYKDLAMYVENDDKLEFLSQILPKKITVKQYKAMMAKKPDTDDDTDSEDELEEESGNEATNKEGDDDDDDDDVVEIVDDDNDKAQQQAQQDSEDSASDSGESNSVISIDSSSDEKENSKNVSNKKSPSTVDERLIARFNQELGADLKNSNKCGDLVKYYRSELEDLRAKITVTDAACIPSVKSMIETGRSKLAELDEKETRLGDYEEKINEQIEAYQQLMNEVGDKMEQIRVLQTVRDYMALIKDIENISQELEASIGGKDDSKPIALYVALTGPNSILDRISGIEAPHLKMYARNTAFHWHDVLTAKYSTEFEALLKTIKWPNMNQTLEQFNPSKDHINKLVLLAEYLFLVKLPGDQDLLSQKLTPSIICPHYTTPVQLFVKPFRLRFQFHFSGNKQTNRLDRPEWYLTQVLMWAKENHIFVGQHFQSPALRAGIVNSSVRLEFVRGLVQLAIEKLIVDIEQIVQDEALFAHLIDEVLPFEQDLKSSLGYPNSYPSVVSVLVQPAYFIKWMAIEKKFTTDKMDAMLNTDDPFELLDPANLDELKIPKCADQFIRLLDAIKERYCCLPQPSQQLQFLELQRELIDNFRCRLLQLYNDGISPTKILNALNYLTSVLREWGENVHYLHLHAALYGPDADEISSVFDQTIEELNYCHRKLVEELVTWIVHEITARSRPYRYDLWPSMNPQDAKETLMVSASASEMFQTTINHLHDMERELSTNVFMIVVRMIATELDQWMISSMVMNTKFSAGGAQQFHFDMTRNLFGLFSQYAKKTNLLFKRINDSCILLTMPLGSAILLRETLLSEAADEDGCIRALQDVGLTIFDKKATLDVLDRRNDMPRIG
uniref:Chromatin accessibility complex protein 1 n=1 Tax=Anopheles epiroticus TaxID=199890 RepID=A0A182PZ79_9DIPT